MQARKLPAGYSPRGRDWRSSLNEPLVGIIPGSGKRQASQRRKRRRACFLHDQGAMVLDSALANAKIRGDSLTVVTSEDEFHDLALPRTQNRDAVGRDLVPNEQLA
jgi:hypothetical protein